MTQLTIERSGQLGTTAARTPSSSSTCPSEASWAMLAKKPRMFASIRVHCPRSCCPGTDPASMVALYRGGQAPRLAERERVGGDARIDPEAEARATGARQRHDAVEPLAVDSDGAAAHVVSGQRGRNRPAVEQDPNVRRPPRRRAQHDIDPLGLELELDRRVLPGGALLGRLIPDAAERERVEPKGRGRHVVV